MKKTQQILCGILAAIFLCPAGLLGVFAQPAVKTYNKQEIRGVATGIINWKKLDNGSTTDGFLINNKFLEQAGTTAGDWYPVGLGRLGVKDDYAGYLAVVKEEVEKRYRTPEKLSAAKATEWHRISLAVLAAGGDPIKFGKDANGVPINLIADGTYNRGKTTSLGKQGINGWIWGLITLDTMRYPIPAGSFYSRDDIIVEILKKQLADGGFALSGKISDPDITGMAIQALSPYYNSKNTYTYNQKAIDNKQVVKSVRKIVDESLAWLSGAQLPDGDFASWGTRNAESTAQVAVALCCLGLDPQKDERFIKNGKSVIDGLLKYRMADGGFVHSLTYQTDNPSSLPDKSNTMASEQVLYSLAAIWRQMSGMSTLYDFRSPASTPTSTIPAKPGTVPSTAPLTPAPEKPATVPSTSPTPDDSAVDDSDDNSAATTDDEVGGDDNLILHFSVTDRSAVDALPSRLTTEQYVDVIKLLTKIEQSDNFEGKDEYLKKLTKAKADIAATQAEIDAINKEVKEKLYPFNSLGLRDKAAVDDIVRRYKNLGSYDQNKIERVEDILKAKTKTDNLLRAIILSIVLTLVAVTATVLVVRRLQKLRHKKQRAMEELAADYEDKE